MVSLACEVIGVLTTPVLAGEKAEDSEAPYFDWTVLCTSDTGDASMSTE